MHANCNKTLPRCCAYGEEIDVLLKTPLIFTRKTPFDGVQRYSIYPSFNTCTNKKKIEPQQVLI
jgi:hypothetical protein